MRSEAGSQYRHILSKMKNSERETGLFHGEYGVTEDSITQIPLVEEPIFYCRDNIYSSDDEDNLKLSLALQREVINKVIPQVRPDMIHSHDWMTGLIPAAARRLGISCLFTVHNIHTFFIKDS